MARNSLLPEPILLESASGRYSLAYALVDTQPAFESLAQIVSWDHRLKTARSDHMHDLSEAHGSRWKSGNADIDARLVLSSNLVGY